MTEVRKAALRSEALAFIDRLEADEDLNPRVLAFREAVFQVLAMHDKKQADYGKEGDPFANIRSSEEWGIAPWVGAMVRANDKVKRLQRFAGRGTLANESAEDSLLDIAVYSIIGLVLYREASEQPVDELATTAMDPNATCVLCHAFLSSHRFDGKCPDGSGRGAVVGAAVSGFVQP